jgi:hypothetical protein
MTAAGAVSGEGDGRWRAELTTPGCVMRMGSPDTCSFSLDTHLLGRCGLIDLIICSLSLSFRYLNPVTPDIDPQPQDDTLRLRLDAIDSHSSRQSPVHRITRLSWSLCIQCTDPPKISQSDYPVATLEFDRIF